MRRRGHQTRDDAADLVSQLPRDLDAARGRAHGAALALNRDDVRGLARTDARVSAEILRDDLLAAQRDRR